MSERIKDLACKGEMPAQEPEVRVEIKDNDEWVRIPVTMCDLNINKDGPSDLTRNAKVKFPIEWDGEDIRQYINGLQVSDDGEDSPPYDECRIWFYDHEDDTYQIAHYGYVGGVGPAVETGIAKFYVYDAADLMRGIQVSKTWGEPTIAQVMEFVLRGEDDNGRAVGLEHRSVFDNIQSYLAGLQEVKMQKEDTSDFGGEENDGDDYVLKSQPSVLGSLSLNMNDLVDDVFDYMFGTDVTNGVLGGQKRFQLNRNNMVDLMNWFATEVGGKWHFEPTPTGPVLFFDNTNAEEEENQIFGDDEEDGDFSRRVFRDDELEEGEVGGDIGDFKDRDAFTTVDVIDNNALYDIKPFNTLVLYGEGETYRARYNGGLNEDGADYSQSGAPGPMTETFPKIKVTYPPLKERAGGYEYAAPTVESDKVYLDQAVKAAKNQFRHHLEEESEGTITTKGEPYILPYDYITTVPQCNDTFVNADVAPITYEVNSVTHKRSAGERYTSRLGVSLVFDESLLEIEKEYTEA